MMHPDAIQAAVAQRPTLTTEISDKLAGLYGILKEADEAAVTVRCRMFGSFPVAPDADAKSSANAEADRLLEKIDLVTALACRVRESTYALNASL